MYLMGFVLNKEHSKTVRKKWVTCSFASIILHRFSTWFGFNGKYISLLTSYLSSYVGSWSISTPNRLLSRLSVRVFRKDQYSVYVNYSLHSYSEFSQIRHYNSRFHTVICIHLISLSYQILVILPSHFSSIEQMLIRLIRMTVWLIVDIICKLMTMTF